MPFDKDPASSSFFRFGITGVDLFFMISGFVITMSINNIKTGKEFIVNRFARLYPVYWICLTLSFIVCIYRYHISTGYPVQTSDYVQYAVNLSMFQYYFNILNIEDPYWSLIVELLFYVVIFTVYKLKQLHRIEPILFCLVIFQMAVISLIHYYPEHPDLKNIIAAEKYFILIQFLPLFLIGIVFYKILTEKATLLRYLIVVVCYIQQILEYSERPILGHFYVKQWHYSICLAIFILLFFLFVNKKLQFIANKITIFLGRISYPLYLFHQNIIFLVLLPYFLNKLLFSYLISGILSLIIVITIASIITVFLDEPIRNKIRKAMK